MNWINSVVRPKIRSFLTTKRDVPDNMWATCPETGQMVFRKDLEENHFVFPGSEYHEQMTAPERLAFLFGGEEDAYTRVELPDVKSDPLKFRDKRKYAERVKEARTKTDMSDAILVGEGDLQGQPVVIAAQDFRFMAGSLGMAAGEAIIAGMLRAVQRKAPFILVAASGGARMQEGIMSLMQMPRTTIAIQRLREAKLPYIVVLTNPTTGGVTASYAMLGDIQIAEPGALICFAGPRVIQQTIREKLPEGFQRAEYLLEHGMVDMVVHRHELPDTLARVCRLLTKNGRPNAKGVAAVDHAKNGKSTDLSKLNGKAKQIEANDLTKDEQKAASGNGAAHHAKVEMKSAAAKTDGKTSASKDDVVATSHSGKKKSAGPASDNPSK